MPEPNSIGPKRPDRLPRSSVAGRITRSAIGRRLRSFADGGDLFDVVRGAAAYMVIRVGGAALAFLAQVLLAQWMGPFEYGVFTYAWVWVIMIGVLAPFGFDTTILRFVPQYTAKDQWNMVAGVMRGSRRVVFASGFLLAAIGCVVVFFASGAVAPHYIRPLYVAMASVPLFALLTFYISMTRSFGWVGLAVAPFFLVRVSLLIIGTGTLIIVAGDTSANTVLIVAFASCLVALVGQAVIFERRLSQQVKRAQPTYQFKHWFAVSIPLFFVSSSYLLMANTDILMLGAYLDPDSVGIYNAAARTVGFINFVMVALSALSAPRFSSLYFQGKHDDLKALVTAVVRWTFWPSLLLAAVLIVLGDTILALFGPAFIAGQNVLIVLAAGHVVAASAGNVSNLLSMTGNHKMCAMAVGSSAVLNIGLNVALIPVMGMMGAAVAMVIAMILNTVWLVLAARRRLGIHPFIIPIGLQRLQGLVGASTEK